MGLFGFNDGAPWGIHNGFGIWHVGMESCVKTHTYWKDDRNQRKRWSRVFIGGQQNLENKICQWYLVEEIFLTTECLLDPIFSYVLDCPARKLPLFHSSATCLKFYLKWLVSIIESGEEGVKEDDLENTCELRRDKRKRSTTVSFKNCFS